jgi:ribosome maturation factor RimP
VSSACCFTLCGSGLAFTQYDGLGVQPFFFEYMVDLFALTQQALAGMDVELVDVERAGLGLLRVTIDRAEGVRIEDCEQVSRQLSRIYEVENIDYKRLEVGSPGIDRPLRAEADFYRFLGARIEIKLREALNGCKVFSGILTGPQPVAGQADSTAPGSYKTVFGLEFEAKKNDIQIINFTLDEIERAKLDPVLDFKGKKR